jgi:hypothetical protein
MSRFHQKETDAQILGPCLRSTKGRGGYSGQHDHGIEPFMGTMHRSESSLKEIALKEAKKWIK